MVLFHLSYALLPFISYIYMLFLFIFFKHAIVHPRHLIYSDQS